MLRAPKSPKFPQRYSQGPVTFENVADDLANNKTTVKNVPEVKPAESVPNAKVDAPSSNQAEELANWVDEGGNLRAGGNPGMRPDAYEFQSGASGARSNPLSGRSQAPYLEFTDDAGKVVGAKFDGVQGSELIDRKLNPVFSAKAVDQARRQSAVAKHYCLKAVWELPDQKALDAANRFLQSNNITGITTRLAQ